MKKHTFKIGDRVKIVNLKDTVRGGTFIGNIGHVGKITGIEKGVSEAYTSAGLDKFYIIEPEIPGKCFPASCLELVKPGRPKKSNTLFSIDDL